MISYSKIFGRLALLLILWAGLASPLTAQDPPTDTETWNEYKSRLLRELAAEAAAGVATERTAAAVAAKPTSVTPPEGFAGRVNDSFADFLPLFQFAVDSVSTSDDQTAVTVKFNPLKLDIGALSLTATVAEPRVFSQLEDAIAEPARVSQREALLKGIDDFSDVTAALSFGYRRTAGNWSTKGRLFGRDAVLYRNLLEDLLVATFAVVPPQIDALRDKADVALGRLALPLTAQLPGRQLDTITFGEIRALIENDQLDEDFEARLLDAMGASVDAQREFNAFVGSLNLDALPVLIDNQPQVVVSASHRASAEVVGPDETTYTFSYEMGSNNLNEVRTRYRQLVRQRSDTAPSATPQELDQLKLNAFRDVIDRPGFGKEQRFVFSFTFKDVSEYSFRHGYDLVGADGTGIPQMVDLRLNGTREWRTKVLWTRLMPMVSPAPPAGLPLSPTVSEGEQEEQRPRFSLSVEGVWPEGRTEAKDRVIARLSYLLPVARGVTLPVTVTYANRDELLEDQDHVFSGHVGISYKLGKGFVQGSGQ